MSKKLIFAILATAFVLASVAEATGTRPQLCRPSEVEKLSCSDIP